MPGYRPLPERFEEKYVVDPSGCWLWTAHRDPRLGYGTISGECPPGARRGPKRKAHVVAWELYVGPVPEGLELDHLCRVRHCVNPEHLEPVSHQENCLRAYRDAEMCRNGLHPKTPENIQYDSLGRPTCRPCRKDARLQRIANGGTR